MRWLMVGWLRSLVGLALNLPVVAVLAGVVPAAVAQEPTGFLCDQDGNERSGGYPSVMVVSNGQRIHLLTVTESTELPPFDDVIARCNQIVARFQNAFITEGAEVFNYLTFSYVNDRPVLCIPLTPQDRQNGTCQSNDVLITFRNEQRGCLFVPAFLQNLKDQGAGHIPENTDFDAMRNLCRQRFPENSSQSAAQVHTMFRSLNPVAPL